MTPANTHLKLVNVFQRGLPNQEHIAIYVQQQTSLNLYAVLMGQSQGPQLALPYQDNFFWLGNGIVNAGDWIFIFTGSGQGRIEPLNNGVNKTVILHWGRKSTVFANSNIVPILVQIDQIQIGPPPSDMLQ